MDAISRAHAHYGNSLVLRGILLLLLGLVGLAWPEQVLLFTALAATVALALFGLYDIVLGVRSRMLSRGWPLPVATGIVCVTFATLSLMVPGMVLRVALVWIAMWLVACSSVTLVLAFALWPMRRTRIALLAWSGGNIVLALATLFYPDASIVTVFYAGAFYALGTGVLHLVGGLWIRKEVLPRVEPTAQSAWEPLYHA